MYIFWGHKIWLVSFDEKRVQNLHQAVVPASDNDLKIAWDSPANADSLLSAVKG